MIFRFLITIASLLFALACSSGDDGSDVQEVSIAHLKSLCKGDHYRIAENISVRGVVAATEWLGELNKSAIVVDATGGLEISIESSCISDHLPIYSEVVIFCNGLMLSRIGGKIELGAPPTGDFPLDNIDDEMIDRYIRIVGVCENFVPTTKQFSDIVSADISNIVRFDNIRICDEEQGLAWCDTDEDGAYLTTYRTLVDGEGATLSVCTLPTCRHAKEMIPTKEISVVGAIDYFDNRYFLRIVNGLIIE